MATQTDPSPHEPPLADYNKRISQIWKRILGKNNTPTASASTPQGDPTEPAREGSPGGGILRRASRRVVPGLPRAKTFKRQQSEVREKLEVDKPTPAERRAVSVDRRGPHPLRNVSHQSQQPPRASAPDFLVDTSSTATSGNALSAPQSPSPAEEREFPNIARIDSANHDVEPPSDEAPPVTKYPSRAASNADAHSITTSFYDAQIHDELERKWILNLSMHFRDKSKREKFFVTYREEDFLWRRVTISLDYRDALDDSLEKDLLDTKFQREKSAKIYEAIRESLRDIQFYETVTNLKLQTTEGRLHVHVVEDVNEIIHYPTVRMVQHLKCRRIREGDLEFDSHMSGFVYKVRVNGQTLIKKEIPGPDTVDEFLYEVNALNSLRFSQNVIPFYGVVVDDNDQIVKGLLIDYAAQGALIDVIYDSQEHGLDLPWSTREKWAQQIVQGLSDIHESGFVQGDFTLSNIVIDDDHNAKIIDINRRGCPVGWEPPEATPLIDSNQRISMYIGVKSDLYQLGMVLWALATLEDEPEAHRRPLHLDPEIEVPKWYRRMVENCLNENPRVRLQATALLAMFPEPVYDEEYDGENPAAISVDDGYEVRNYVIDGYGHGRPVVRTVTPQSDWYYSGMDQQSGVTSPGLSEDACYFPPRGRSPPSPLPSHRDGCDSPYIMDNGLRSGSHVRKEPPSASDIGPDELRATTPRDDQSATVLNTAEELEGDLKVIRTECQKASVDEHIAVLGGSQSSEVIPTNELSQAPEIEINEVESSSGHHGPNDPVNSDGPTPTGQPPEPQCPVALVLGAKGKEDLKPSDGPDHDPESENGKDADNTTPIPDATPHQRDDNAGDGTDFGINYLHNRKEAITYTPASSNESSSSAQEPETRGSTTRGLPSELTGIGTAYGAQEDIRQQICSDEDLGLTTATTTAAPQNVTSQA
ncbi:protein kinase [Xylariales sp. AK1849]|nr:protein kinase [Xylariales sp. AK1849]